MQSTRVQAGDTVTVNGRQLEVLGLMDAPVTVNNDGFINGVQFVMSDILYEQLASDNRYQEIFSTLAPVADTAAFEETLDAFCGETPGSAWLSYRNTDAQLAESFAQIRLLCWGLILFIGLIGVLNIINTVYTDIHTRVQEIGMQRALGMSARILYQTFF